MDNAEFIKEIHDYIDQEYNQFNEYQNIVLDVLHQFCLLCDKNEIFYTMAYGTMLGAVRDHGQIPWDYDIDVFVPNSYRERLLSVLDTKLGDGFYYTYKTNLKNYPAPCLRICKKGYTYMALHVDVFFLVGTPESKLDRDKFVKNVNALSKTRMQKYVFYHLPPIKEVRIKRFYHILSGLKLMLITSKKLNRKEDRLFEMYKFEESSYCMAFTDDPITYPTSWFLEREIVKFGKLNVFVPKGYEGFLSKKFKSYSTYLSIKSRFREFMDMKAVVDERQKYFEDISVPLKLGRS